MIGTALRAAAGYVDERAADTAWDTHQRLTDEQRAAKADKIRAVTGELRSLADASETRKVRYAEYEVLKDRLYILGFLITSTVAQDVATAFHDAEGPTKPREKGWLNRP